MSALLGLGLLSLSCFELIFAELRCRFLIFFWRSRKLLRFSFLSSLSLWIYTVRIFFFGNFQIISSFRKKWMEMILILMVVITLE